MWACWHVWGIMHAFTGLAALTCGAGHRGPGIAEACGHGIILFAAIPAVVAYNRFARDLDRIAIQQAFIEEFSISCSAMGAQPAAPAAR